MTLGLLYATLLGLGVVYALLVTVFSWIGDHDVGGVHLDGAGDLGQPHPISGTIVATFITGFGGGGTIATYLLEWSLLGTMLAATSTGLVMAGAAFLVLDLLFSQTQAGSEFQAEDAVGRSAEVITTIPAQGIGEIAYLLKGQRLRSAARAVGGEAIPKGTLVEIERMLGAVAHVRPPRATEGDSSC